jgi:bifunctional N-acetylglucosamine-1-phosphate-uridyltransferase/glucosamine-1-phosphate-acetyltransferase GlmU-like protein
MMQSFKEIENQNENICTVILKVDNQAFNINKKPYELKLFGKTMTEWVANAVYDTQICYANYNFNDDFLPIVKNATNSNSKYTVVLFSDTPLFQHKTFLEIMEYFKIKGLSVLKFTRGYVFETNYLMQIDSLLNPQFQYFEEEDFITCLNLKQTAMVEEVLKNRILSYFMKKGVIIEDPSSTFIDADCQIEAGTIIKPFNQIRGNSIIEANALIDSNCIIENSVVLSNATIKSSKISNSLIGKNVTINENCVISNNAKICDEVALPPFVNVDGVVINKDANLNSFCTYKAKD